METIFETSVAKGVIAEQSHPIAMENIAAQKNNKTLVNNKSLAFSHNKIHKYNEHNEKTMNKCI